MMNELIAAFPQQLREAVEITKNTFIKPISTPVKNIMVTGLGGSGMGANMVYDLLNSQLHIPFMVNKDYVLPASVGVGTLVIASSYSGNTEETLAAFEQARQRGAHIVCITSGGKLAQLAQQYQCDIAFMPAGKPSPRACLGYSLVQQLHVLAALGFAKPQILDAIVVAANWLDGQTPQIQTEAQNLANGLIRKIPVIYAPAHAESVAIRWRQQINENSKMLAWHHVIPEMNHNELVGWRIFNDQLGVVFFELEDTHPRTALRMQLNRELISQYTPHIFRVQAKGVSLLQRILYLTCLGDWLSWYLAQLRGVDAMEVNVIDQLKNALGKVN
ncbi:MAG: bifunctional phosphoglucose/phosphomannose isomerase [Sphingobacteriales bacterium]|jgi:glucose/mannose-6-phosphate isomerase|nr:bifunctional phosphoglucose/phosphomannose isomerase [Sphingobacteriales bacterium]MBP9140447.1 bifunctional phosphoglucose/phosphomannose isomerase [Chitinophagales bacterium]MDA0197453.1 bifunctional phosphoglucose/phosphomannose isomerase [Bacteroidota bacterium]MBK6891292.1 bifunctional phosphoglucose/phosphomannose isomerase [Sphingobacteriales bacterium]MBK7526878.1 bifunctional phosphoglucose/phosphomannose isomerase [Sphingobacteriales bacterium]